MQRAMLYIQSLRQIDWPLQLINRAEVAQRSPRNLLVHALKNQNINISPSRDASHGKGFSADYEPVFVTVPLMTHNKTAFLYSDAFQSWAYPSE